jgi:hypothetical protein
MKWYYNVRKRKRILGISLIILLVCSASLYAKLNGMGTENDAQKNSLPQSTNTPQIPQTTTTSTPLPTPEVTPTLVPTATPTTIPTETPIITPTATPTATVIITPTPTIKKPTPTITVKVTPKKTVQHKTNAPIKTPAKPVVVPETKVVLRYKNGNSVANTDNINPMFKIINNGNQSVKLSNITIRYYFTKEKNVNETFWCDSFTKGSGNVIGKFVSLSNKKEMADRYLEIGFKEAAGVINPGENLELAVGFANNDWEQYSQKNDYSYSSSRTYFDWNRVTLYISGKLVYGKEP